jgi:hypothetical protein
MALYHILGLSKWKKLARSGLVPFDLLKAAPYELYKDFEDDLRDICVDSKQETVEVSENPIAGRDEGASYGDENYSQSAFAYNSKEFDSSKSANTVRNISNVDS